MHSFHVLKEVCEKYDIKCELMPGATSIHATIKMASPKWFGRRLYGTCGGTSIRLDVIGRGQIKLIDLADPDSIDDLDQFLGNWDPNPK